MKMTSLHDQVNVHEVCYHSGMYNNTLLILATSLMQELLVEKEKNMLENSEYNTGNIIML